MVLPNFNVKEVAEFLLDNGIDSQREVAICERLSYPDERMVKTTLLDVLNENFSYMCVMVIFKLFS